MIKFIVYLFKATIRIGVLITGIITVGALAAALIDTFPVVGILLAVILLSVVIYKVTFFIRDKRKKKFFREAEETRH